MADEPENLVLRQLREMRAEMRDGFEKQAAETGRIHAELTANVGRIEASVAKVHAEVLASKSLVLDVVVKLTNLEKRVTKLEPHEPEHV